MSLKNIFGKLLLSAVLCVSLLAALPIPASADRDDKCRHDIQKAEQNLDKAVRKHGEHSRQAEQRRHELDDVRARCHWVDHDHH